MSRSASMRDKVRPARGFQQLTREKVRPTRPLQRHFREKVRPTRLKTAFFGRFGHAGRTFSRFRAETEPQGELFRAFVLKQSRGANFFAHRTQPRADFETNDTSAGTDADQRETTITNATKKRTKNTHFSPAKATAVSVEARPTRAKATPVSTQHSHKVGKASPVSPQRSDALDTEPMHQIAQHCTGN